MSISDKIQALEASRQAIATAISQKGGTVAQGDGFSQFSTEISNLPSGGDDSTLRDLIEGDITSITIPSGTTKIRGYAFSACPNLAGDITIPNTVTSIGDYAFAGSSISSVIIPTSVTLFGQYMFNACRSLTSVTLPNNISVLPQCMFQNCSSLASITIPNTVTGFGNTVFSGCSSLNSITIPANVSNLGGSTFKDCSSLTSVTVLATTPPTLGTRAFGNTNNCPIYVPAASVDAYKAANNWSTYADRIFAIGDSILFTPTNGDPAISVKNYELATANYVLSTDVPATIKNGAGSLEICEGVTRIGMSAFQDGTSLTSVTLPSTLTRMDETVFEGCTALTSVTVNATTPPTMYFGVFDNTNNCPIYVPAASVDAYKAANNWSAYADRIQARPVPTAMKWTSSDGTQEISIACEDLVEGTLADEYITAADPNNLAYTVEGSVEIGDCVTRIGEGVFSNCSKLTSVTIGNGVTTIGYNAFKYCDSLTSVTVNATTPPSLESDTFYGTNCPIYVPAESVDTYKADENWIGFASRIQAIPTE